MWRPHLKHEPDRAGNLHPVGWIVVDADGKPYTNAEGAIPAGFRESEAQELADELNAKRSP